MPHSLQPDDVDWKVLTAAVTVRIHVLQLAWLATRNCDDQMSQMFRRDILMPSLSLLLSFIEAINIGDENENERRLQ
jgi:hypothetical protein